MLNINFKIKGMHCSGCENLIETELSAMDGVNAVKVDYNSGKCDLSFNQEKITEKEIIKAIEKMNYHAQKNGQTEIKSNTQKQFFKKNIIIALVLILLISGYFIIQKSGLLEILSELNEQNLSYSLIFIIGLLASFHCVGMCGGLVVSYSAKYKSNFQNTKRSDIFLPHLQYNFGRFLSYSIIGAILGGIGSFFAINPLFSAIIIIVAGVLMILMGVSFIINNIWLQKIKGLVPLFISKRIFSQIHKKKSKSPLFIGLINGFMPCGPLQAMQLYALASGSLYKGFLSMGIYALGTIPLMFGLGSMISLINIKNIKNAAKISGLIIIILGIIMLNRGLTSYGFRAPKSLTNEIVKEEQKNKSEYQTAKMDLNYNGYSPSVLYIKKNIPVRWIINVKQMSGCTDEIIMPDYNIRRKLQKGENIIEFTPKNAGTIKFSCWMQMVWGKFIVN